MNPRSLLFSLIAAFALTAGSAFAEFRLASPFADHMVLQREMPVPIWGEADAGTTVTVTFAGQQKTATADENGHWRVDLEMLTASSDGRALTATSGSDRINVEDVLVGEVWLGSGQSNMAFTVSKDRSRWAGLINEEEEIAAANFPLIRMFTAEGTKTYEAQDFVEGTWEICTPETVPGFSAIGYLFAQELRRELDVPVGILTVAYGASTAEAWISREKMTGDAQMKPMLDALDASVSFYRAHPDVSADEAPPPPRTLNARPRQPGRPQRDPVRDQHYPTVLFNGMLNPVIPYAIRGALWYQGESICGGTPGLNMYGHVQQQMVLDWRERWGRDDLPFYLVQLPGQENLSNNPRVREEQAEVINLPHTGMAVTIDVGEARDVHPHNKRPVAHRLALLALANDYGRNVSCYSPTYASMQVVGDSIRIKFEHAPDGLITRGSILKGFQVAGADRNFVAAEARIEGDTVVVRSSTVAAPVAVRYGWDNYPEGMGCNLNSATGLPAAPFRTDDWDYLIEGIVES